MGPRTGDSGGGREVDQADVSERRGGSPSAGIMDAPRLGLVWVTGAG
jgi:hypothetical protein